MLEHIVDSLFSQYGIMGLGLCALSFAIWNIAKYYMYTIIPQQQKRADKRDEMMQKSIDTQSEASRDIKELITTQGISQQHMCKVLDTMTQTLENTSKNVATHDEKSNAIISSLRDQGIVINTMAGKVATAENISKIHDRLDEGTKAIATVQEKVNDMEDRIDSISDGVNKTFQAVNEIKYTMANMNSKKTE